MFFFFFWGGGFFKTFLEGSVNHIIYKDCIVNRSSFIDCSLAAWQQSEGLVNVEQTFKISNEAKYSSSELWNQTQIVAHDAQPLKVCGNITMEGRV